MTVVIILFFLFLLDSLVSNIIAKKEENDAQNQIHSKDKIETSKTD